MAVKKENRNIISETYEVLSTTVRLLKRSKYVISIKIEITDANKCRFMDFFALNTCQAEKKTFFYAVSFKMVNL